MMYVLFCTLLFLLDLRLGVSIAGGTWWVGVLAPSEIAQRGMFRTLKEFLFEVSVIYEIKHHLTQFPLSHGGLLRIKGYNRYMC